MEKRVYFKNLNGLRFFAAFAVILHHLEQYKYWAKLPSNWGNVTVDAFGHKAVSFFFVLSGFLISLVSSWVTWNRNEQKLKKIIHREVDADADSPNGGSEPKVPG